MDRGARTGSRWSAGVRLALAVSTVFGLLFALAIFWGVRTHGHSPIKIGVYALLVWYGWAAGAPLVGWLGQRWPLVPFSLRTSVVHLAAAGVLGTLHDLWWTGLSIWIRPYDDMGSSSFWPSLVESYSERAFVEVLLYFAVLGATYAVDYQRRLRAKEVASLQLEQSLARASLHALELQMQPHFLFNTLHAIGGLVRVGRSGEAIEMIAGLSDLLRYSLEHAGRHLVPLEREIHILGRYLEIQRIRFPDRLAVTVDVPVELRRAAVPALILQPLAENAVRHGIERSAAAGVIEVTAALEGDSLRLEIFNSGRMAGEVRPGIGLDNTRARLEQLYPGRHSFGLENERGGVVASIEIPFEEAAP